MKAKKKETTIGDLKRRINAMRTTKRQNDDGTVSTHVMAWGGNDEEGYSVYPTIFPNDDGTWTDPLSAGETDENWNKVLEEAGNRGEIIGGLSKEMASSLADGSWKNMGKVDLPIKKFKKGGAMKVKKKLLKRKDGSYSPRGLWDNIRRRRGSGKKPTKAMLEQDKEIKKGEGK